MDRGAGSGAGAGASSGGNASGGTTDAGGSGGDLLFVKEEVKPIAAGATKSLLSSSLQGRPRMGGATASSRIVPMSPIKVQPRQHRRREYASADERKTASVSVGGAAPVSSPFHGLTPPASVARAHDRARSRSVSAVASPAEVAPQSTLDGDNGGFSVAHVIRQVIARCAEKGCRFDKKPHEYHLRIAEDGSPTTVDFDFPELDGTCELITVGVSKLLLAEASSDRVVLLLKLPEEVVGLRREQRAKLTKIDVTCTPTTGRIPPVTIPVLSSLMGFA